MRRTVRIDVGEVTVREEGLVYARVFPESVIGVNESEEYHSMVAYLTHSEPHVTIIVISGIKELKKGARELLVANSNEWGKTLALALITNSLASKIFGNFFLAVNRLKYPVKIFSDYTAAHNWAKQEYFKGNAKAAF